MTRSCKPAVFILAMLTLAFTTSTRAAEEAEDKKAETPTGYEEAGQAGKSKKRAKKATPSDKKREKGKAEAPVGYEEAGQADKSRKRVRKKVVAPLVPPPAEQEQLDDEKLFEKNPQLKALIEQVRPKLQPLFAAELTFAKTVCEPNQEQFKKMRVQAAPELEKVLRSFAIQQAPRMGIQIGGKQIRHRGQQTPKIYEDIEKAASRIVSDVFPEETVKIYQDEQNHRREFRSRSGAMALVAHLDTQYRLSQDQRKELTESIQQVWQRQWQHSLQHLANNPQFFPQVPDDAIVPHLNEVQAKQWQNMQRHQIGFHWQNINNNHLFRKMKPEIDWFKDRNKGGGFAALGGGFRVDLVVPVEDAAEDQDE
ncbi:MAG: hypothetical protein GXP26_12700 [Planctomycetes bacterium]|nr:hypothetical protein [Planctomycetota bacterium]